MRQVAARRHHNKKRAEGFIPNDHGQDTNNDTGNGPVGGNNPTTTTAVTTTTTTQSSSSIVRPTTTTTTTTTAPPTTTTTTQPATSSTTTTIASSSSSSSLVVVAASSSTPVVIQASLSTNQLPTTATLPITRSIATPTLGTASLSSASPSATAAAQDSGPQIGPLVGAIGGGLIGVIAIAAVAGYFFRRAFRKKDEFDRSEFVRNSVAIHDDYNEKPAMGTSNAMALARGNNNVDEPSATPRPPSMFERRGQGQPAYGVGETMNTGYYGQQDQYYNNYGANGYYGQDQYAAGYDQQQQQQYGASDHPYVAGGAYGYTPPNEYQQSQLTRKPSAPLGAARGPGSEYQQQQQGPDHVASPAGDYPAATQFDARQSVTPFQQQQYNDINKALNGGVTPVTENPAGGRELSTAYSALNQPQQPAHGQQPHANAAAPSAHQQAANNRKSVYDEDDAYGGI